MTTHPGNVFLECATLQKREHHLSLRDANKIVGGSGSGVTAPSDPRDKYYPGMYDVHQRNVASGTVAFFGNLMNGNKTKYPMGNDFSEPEKSENDFPKDVPSVQGIEVNTVSTQQDNTRVGN